MLDANQEWILKITDNSCAWPITNYYVVEGTWEFAIAEFRRLSDQSHRLGYRNTIEFLPDTIHRM
jgi:hypothetical protein